MDEFEALVKRTHDQDLKFIIDFVPNHVARQYHSDIFPERDFGIDDDTRLGFSPMNDFYYIPGQQLHLPDNAGTNCGFAVPVEPYVEFPAKATGNDQFSAFPSINEWYETENSIMS
jgi:glycosidase